MSLSNQKGEKEYFSLGEKRYATHHELNGEEVRKILLN
jgi:hypothetical protein